MPQETSRRDLLLGWFLKTCAGISAGVIFLIGAFVLREAIPALRQIGLARFVTDQSWSPTASEFNMTPMLVGTLSATLGATLLTGPLGLGSAIFTRFYAPPGLAVVYRRVIEMSAGIPSVVYGLWGLTVVVPMIAHVSPLGQGQSLLAGIVILTMMTLPTVAVTAEAALAAVPSDHLNAAAALGFSRRAIIWSVVVPAARHGITTGIILQIGRALGETMAVLMICGNVVQTPDSLFAPIRTLTANIALEMGYADPAHRSVLFVSGLILLVLVAAIMLIAEWARRERTSVVS